MSASSSETNLASQAVAPPRLRRLPRRVDRDSTIQSQDEDPAYSTDSNSTAAEDFDKVKSKKHKISFPKFSRRSRQTPSPSQPPSPLTPTKPTWEVSRSAFGDFSVQDEVRLWYQTVGMNGRNTVYKLASISTPTCAFVSPTTTGMFYCVLSSPHWGIRLL